MELSKIDIHVLLPQREPFIMVGKLLHFSMERTVTSTEIDSSNIFVENGRLTASGIIENMAQTCAARIGYINKFILKRGIQLGFIGAVRNFELYRCPELGEVIETVVDTEEEVFGMTLVKATVSIGDEIIATSSMKIAISEQESKTGERNYE